MVDPMETSPRRRERVFGTLAGKLVGILVTFLVAALAVIGFTLLQSWTLEGGAAAINDIGSERMRTYRIVYLLSEYARGPRDEATAREVRATVLAFETALTGVRRGDPARPLFLPRGREIAERMDAVEQSWQQSIRPAIQAALAGGGEPALQRLRHDVDPFVGRIDALVRAIETHNAEGTNVLRNLQMGLVALAIVGTVGMIYLMFLLVIRPVSVLVEGIGRLQAEDFSARVPEETRDEFGALARAFNSMAMHLQSVYATLEARVRDKTQRLEDKNRELATLYEVTVALNEGSGREALCRAFLAPIIEAFSAAGGSVRLRHAEAHGLHMFVSEGLPAELIEAETCEHATACFCGRADEQNRSIVGAVAPDGRPCARVGLPGVIAIPIRFNRKVLGIFNLFFHEVAPVDSKARRLLEMLGQHLGAALENERLQSKERELAVSEERGLIARELHDSIAQSLAFLNLQTQMLDTSLARGDLPAARDEVRQIRVGVQESYDDVRELLVHFRARVRDADLSSALRQSVERFEAQTGIATRFEESGAGIDPPAEAQLQLLHVVQEALSNIRKHARAQHVTVSLERGAVCRFRVRDDGVGFDPAKGDSSGNHVGLHIMRERTHRIGASVDVRSAPGEGTEVSISLPLAPGLAARDADASGAADVSAAGSTTSVAVAS
jgi:two-component system nitrate/nitrite sensor histidine kinase NarX